MINIEMMVVMWTTKLEVLLDLKHLGSMEEPKCESEQVAQLVYTGPQNQMIRMHDDRGSCLQICCHEMHKIEAFPGRAALINNLGSYLYLFSGHLIRTRPMFCKQNCTNK